MILDSRIAAVKEAYSIQSLDDWQRITPSDVLSIDDVGPVTLDHVRLYLAGRNVTLAGDETPEYWKKYLGEARICHKMAEGEDGDVCPFTVLVDSNEKAPWSFQGMKNSSGRQWIVPTEELRLPNDCGDYQVKGIPDVTIERKSLEDLYSTLADREAFKTQCETMNFLMRAAFVVIEATWHEIADPSRFEDDWRSKLHPRAVAGMINSWRLRYPRVHWIAAETRRMAETMSFQILRQAWRHEQ